MNDSSVGLARLRAAFRVARKRLLAWMGISALTLAALSVFTAHAGSVSYTYDTLGRLATVVYSGGTSTTTITYSYDAAGNRTSVATTSP